MKHTIIATGLATYEDAFAVATKIAGKKRKSSWRGQVRIRFRRMTGTFKVQAPA